MAAGTGDTREAAVPGEALLAQVVAAKRLDGKDEGLTLSIAKAPSWSDALEPLGAG